MRRWVRYQRNRMIRTVFEWVSNEILLKVAVKHGLHANKLRFILNDIEKELMEETR